MYSTSVLSYLLIIMFLVCLCKHPTHSTHASFSLNLQPTAATPVLPPKPEPTANYYICVAKYDYDSRADDDINFKKGDLMYIVSSDEGEWWFAHLKKNGKVGYIPSNYVAEYKSLEDEK